MKFLLPRDEHNEIDPPEDWEPLETIRESLTQKEAGEEVDVEAVDYASLVLIGAKLLEAGLTEQQIENHLIHPAHTLTVSYDPATDQIDLTLNMDPDEEEEVSE